MEICSPVNPEHALTPQEERAKLREALANNKNLPQERDLSKAIGKNEDIPSLVRPHNKATDHPAFPLIQHYMLNTDAQWTVAPTGP